MNTKDKIMSQKWTPVIHSSTQNWVENVQKSMKFKEFKKPEKYVKAPHDQDIEDKLDIISS